MAAGKGVVFALLWRWEGTYAVQFAVGVKFVATPGDNFVAVGLMTHVPHNAVVGRVVHIVHGHSYLDCAQTRCKVAGIVGQLVDDVASQFVANGRQLVNAQFAQVGGRVDVLQIFEGFVLFHAISAEAMRTGSPLVAKGWG